MAGDQQEAVVEEERRNGAEVSLSLSKTEKLPMEVHRFSSGVKTAAAVAGGAYVGYQMGKFTGRLAIVCFFSFLL